LAIDRPLRDVADSRHYGILSQRCNFDVFQFGDMSWIREQAPKPIGKS
jgi:hypothetical protein